MPLGAIPRVAFGLCLAVLTLPPGILAFCHRNGAPLLVDEGLGFFFISPRASQSPSRTPDKSSSPVLRTRKFCGGPLKEKVLSKGLSFQ